MNCDDVRENLMDVLAGEQPTPEVLAHLRECGPCTEELEGLRKTMSLLDEWKAPEPSPYFFTRLQAHVREEQQKPPVRAGVWAWFRKPLLTLPLAAILAAGGAFYTYLHWSPPTQTGSSAAVDVEALDKDHDLLTNSNNDLINEMAGLPSQDANSAQDTGDDATI
ncbi:MAG: hypothetical protein ACM3SW_02855 [Actinomycetota bacterium]